MVGRMSARFHEFGVLRKCGSKYSVVLIPLIITYILLSFWHHTAEASTLELMRTGQTTTFAAGDDGSLHSGVPWPSPRFTINNDQTVSDNLTGLVWAKDAGMPTVTGTPTCAGVKSTWQSALDYVTCLNANNYQGHSDWRTAECRRTGKCYQYLGPHSLSMAKQPRIYKCAGVQLLDLQYAR